MVIQVLDRKLDSNYDEETNFESKYLITNGNYVRFNTSLETIYKNLDETSKKYTSQNGFYEIINKPSETLMQEDEKLSMWIDNKDLYCSCPKIRVKRKYILMTKRNNLLKYVNYDETSTSTSTTTTNNVNQPQYQLMSQNTDDNIHLNYELDSDENHHNSSSSSSARLFSRQANKPAPFAKLDVVSFANKSKFAGLLVDRETAIIEWRPNFSRRLRRFLRLYQYGKCAQAFNN